VLRCRPETSCRGRLRPGRMFLVDTSRAASSTTRRSSARSRRSARTREFSTNTSCTSTTCRRRPSAGARPGTRCLQRHVCRRSATTSRTSAGSSRPMARTASSVGSMGNDTPLAVAVEQAAPAVRLLQAAVRAAHQPADRLHPRELITSAETASAPRQPAHPQPSDCRRLELNVAIITKREFAKVRAWTAGPARRRAADPVPRVRAREGPGEVARGTALHGAAPHREESARPHPERSRREQGICAGAGVGWRWPACTTT